MAKAGKGTKKGKGGGTRPDSKSRSAEEIQRARNRVRNLIVDKSEEMARRVIQSVKEGGQITTLKYLWEVSGLFPAEAVEEMEDQGSLLKTLIDRLGLPIDVPEEEGRAEGDVESETSSQESGVGSQ